MATIDITSIDLTQYQATPLLSTEATLTLSLDLFNAKPADAPPHVEKAAIRMLNTASEIKQALIARIEQAGVDVSLQVAFDAAVDRFWSACRQRLFYYITYAHHGLDLLTEGEQDKLNLEDMREKAEIARELDMHLFGTDGLNFLRKPFTQQVALMASRLSFLAASDEFDAYEEVISPELLTTLNVLQECYERMVHERAMRDDNANMRVLRHALQRHITFYASAVLGLVDEDDPESIAAVLEALRPMLNARVRRPRPGEDMDEGTETDPSSETEGEPLPTDQLEPELVQAQGN
jgi:hypothetical protein